jgi:cytochrome oxidase assembly protein ShyY1
VEWRTALFALSLIPLFVALGFWQLDRADEKRSINARWDRQVRQAPEPLETLPEPSPALAFRPVLVSGRPIPGRDFLLDNRINQGRYGVEVISPLAMASGQIVLINRGWLAADPTRQSLPTVPPLPGGVELEGHVYVPPGKSYVLGEVAADSAWPRMVQAAPVPALAEMLGERVYPYMVRLAPGSDGALLADWPLVNAQPEKHTAYAFQWFAMATALFLLFMWRCSNVGEIIRRRKTGEESGHTGQ